MKNLLCKGVVCLAIIAVIVLTGCSPSMKQGKSGETYYTKYNFHYIKIDGEIHGSVANYTDYTGHGVIPYGSKVTVKAGGDGFILTDVKSGLAVDVLVKSKFLGGKSLTEYLDLILSKEPVSYTDLSEIDQKGISAGAVYNGMSKKGVMIALGYPCPHKTPSQKANTWYYWKNRLGSYAVNFKDDVVTSIKPQ